MDKKEARKLVNKKYYEKTKMLKDIATASIMEAETEGETEPEEKKKISTNQEVMKEEENTFVNDVMNTLYSGMMGSIQTIVQTGLITVATVLVSYIVKPQQQQAKQSDTTLNQPFQNVETFYNLPDHL